MPLRIVFLMLTRCYSTLHMINWIFNLAFTFIQFTPHLQSQFVVFLVLFSEWGLTWLQVPSRQPTVNVTHTLHMRSLAIVSDLISQPRLILGRIVGSAFIRSRVCIMASTLWIPYCSRTAPHFRSWTSTKQNTDGSPTFITHGKKGVLRTDAQ